MIIFDTETTGLIKHAAVSLDEQPEIIEFAAIKVNDETLEVVASISTMICPRHLPLPEKITEITGITSDELKACKAFALVLPQIEGFFLGESTVVCHNAPYDIGMLHLELQRLDRVTRFPWPPIQTCTADISKRLFGKRMRLGDFYAQITDSPIEGWHRAMADVMALHRIVVWLRGEGEL